MENLWKQLIDLLKRAPSTVHTTPSSDEQEHDCREQILTALTECRKDINEEDLPDFITFAKEFFTNNPKQDYYRLLDISQSDEDNRIVVIGDTHCDYNSLATIFSKLSLSKDYDYLNNARFIFLGDYLDRGAILFEYLKLLFTLKTILGDRCILLKGNHELVGSVEGMLISRVIPANSCPLLNEYCKDTEFLDSFADYFSYLPSYLLLKTRKNNILLVHGGLPREEYFDQCLVSDETGELICDDIIRNRILSNMIWSDPRHMNVIQTTDTRFEFGPSHFDKFSEINNIDMILRSHEPVTNGVESFYDGRLYTIFSTGGNTNPDTGYSYVTNPSFAIINSDGEPRFESIYYRLILAPTLFYYDNPVTIQPPFDDLHLNDEFIKMNGNNAES